MLIDNDYTAEGAVMMGEAPSIESEVEASKQPIGVAEVRKARELIARYKSDRANLQQRIIDNEEWWKLRHWESMRKKQSNASPFDPASAWLWNVIASKHADAMDAYPEPNILPRMPDDKEEAKKLTSVLPVILEHNEFENVYSDVQWYKLKQGTGVYGVFWDSSMNNGLGDIRLTKIDLLSLFWEGGIEDIQESANVFYESIINNDELEAIYPQLKDKLNSTAQKEAGSYRYDDNVSLEGKSAVIDWYYHKHDGARKVLHYAKFVGEELLFATENEPEAYPNGWYDHGMYPFVFDNMYDVEGTPCGYGCIDIGKSAQEQIDLINESIVRNALLASKPRYFIRGDGSVNEEEFADWSKDFVHTNGNLAQDAIRLIEVQHLNGNYLSLLEMKQQEMKETTGNRDASNGGTQSGVTAASAIAAMQEASGKLSRDSTRGAYRAYRKIIDLCIELIRQFYDKPRFFRITGDMGAMEFAKFDNSGMIPQYQGDIYGMDMGFRKPVFDISVTAQKQNPYTKLTQNELALQFFNLGFFSPQMTDMALSCLDMMDFNGKDEVMQKIQAHGTMQQKLVQLGQLALTMAQEHAPDMVPMIGQFLGLGGGEAPTPANNKTSIPQGDVLGGIKAPEHHRVAEARNQVRRSTQPDA